MIVRPLPLLRVFFYVSLCTFIGACDGPSDEPDGGSSTEQDSGTAVDAFQLGMEKITDSGHFTVRLKSAQPAPPDEGENIWMLEIENQDGDMLTSVTGALTPWMPEHGHGTNPASYDLIFREEGSVYEVGPFTLTMPGIWELKINLATPEQDSVVFTFRAEG